MLFAMGSFTIYVYILRWVGSWPNLHECKRGIGRYTEPCKRLQRLRQLKNEFLSPKKPFQVPFEVPLNLLKFLSMMQMFM